MNENAFGNRKYFKIFSRNLFHIFYKVCQKLSLKKKTGKDFFIYPLIESSEVLLDTANRLAWSLPPSFSGKVIIPVSKDLLNFKFKNIEIPFQRNYLNRNETLFKMVGTEEMQGYLKKSTNILIHDYSKVLSPKILKRLGNVNIIDKNYYSTKESEFLNVVYFNSLSDQEKERYNEISKRNYSNFLTEYNHITKGYCFVTGPSFDSYSDFNFEENSLKVICNSIVKNEEFLNYIKKPDILVFSDPVFHFSPCEYSATFRDYVANVVKKYNCYVVIPDYVFPLFIENYPDLEDKIIGMGIGNKLNFPSIDQFFVNATKNILTLFMLPIASAVSNKVFILGADGRQKSEKYFWKHSSSAQFDDLMQSAFETHPSFFRDRNYSSYYDEHCDNLEKLISFGEAKGKKYYSLTKSFIPALESRFFQLKDSYEYD